jgi:hypothetical protein
MQKCADRKYLSLEAIKVKVKEKVKDKVKVEDKG